MSIELSPKTWEKSPESWQKPSSRIKLKVKKRKASKSSCPSDILVKPSSDQQYGGGRAKRSNPFTCVTEAKRRPSNTTTSSDNRLFKALDNQTNDYQCFNDIKCDGKEEIVERKSMNVVEEESSKTDHTSTTQQECPFFPLDWSLKTKVRFTSSVSFNWASSLKSADMADSVTNFVRCQNVDIFSGSSLLNCASKVWIHPSLPWLQLYPRQSTIKKCDEAIAKSLQSDWVSSFHSLFNLLRCGHCPYFYLCTGQCCMLFIAPSGDKEMVAVITPTTKGFRDALEREGIEFSLPHSKAADSTISDSEDEHDEKENESDHEDWLESVGLDKDQFPSIDKYTKQQQTQIRNKDQQPTSTVMVMGASTLALSNFILNWKSVMSGIPPTLLAPVAFEGATLKSHKISQGIVKHQHDKNMKQLFSLEISGAILPGCLQRVCQLIQEKHDGGFTAVLTPYQCTIPLNVTVDHHLSKLTKAGLTDTELEYFSTTNQQLDKTCLKDIKCTNGLYSWT